MNEIQLEFNLNDASETDVKLAYMQKQLNEIAESMGKVRRKMFAELSEMKKILTDIKNENEQLRNQIKDFKNEKTDWDYCKGEYLFQVK